MKTENAYMSTHRFARIAPRKARLVMDMIRGRDVDEALAILRFSKRRASVMVEQVIRTAVANFNEQETGPGTAALFVSEARVDEGPTIKRFQPKDRGKAHPIMKRTSHLIVSVEERLD
ncbi:MAG: 50S ribosomal protein L22 [Phycisphaerae bacterium]